MKKIITIALAILCVHSFAQTITTKDTTFRNAVLEEFTGIHCGYCPDGHKIANKLLNDNPGKVVLINIHQGSFASPSAGEPDYRTQWGDAIANQTGLTGYPSGTVNRHKFTDLGATTMALDRGSWPIAAATIFPKISPLNVGIESSYNSSNRELTVTVELYYTGNSAVPKNFINVALLQNKVFGPQSSGGAGNNYEHKHMLRHLITGQWGDTVHTTSAGTLYTKTYTYTIPENYNSVPCVVENCEVAVFVTESKTEIITGDIVDAVGGINKYFGKLIKPNVVFTKGTVGQATTFNIKAVSALPSGNQFKFKIVPIKAKGNWTASLNINGKILADTAIVSLDSAIEKNITVSITPGDSAGISTYKLVMQSIAYPKSIAKTINLSVISGVTELVVNAGGSNSIKFESAYTNAIKATGNSKYGVVNSDMLLEGNKTNAFEDVDNIYYNASWDSPIFSDDACLALQSFMNNGVNLFIGGQDVGWDIMSGDQGSNGTTVTKAFYTNYLHANYVADGSNTNSKLTAFSSDPIFGTVAQGTITNVYGGTSMYPDEITPDASAQSIFYYNTTNTKIAGIKAQTTNYKVVYLGIGLEMISTLAVRNDIVNKTMNWFNSSTSTEEFDNSMNALSLGQNHPNPANEYTYVNVVNANDNQNIVITDIYGKIVAKYSINNNSATVKINTAELSNGIYYYSIENNGKLIKTQKLIVRH